MNAHALERLIQFRLLAGLLPPGKTQPRILQCRRCGLTGGELTTVIDGNKIMLGAEQLAVANEVAVLVGTFEPDVVGASVGTKLVGEPIRKSGKVEIVCQCGHRQHWHSAG
ncbi:MAG: hypothetical protein AB7O62_20765 [Pirellulales bacterium]